MVVGDLEEPDAPDGRGGEHLQARCQSKRTDRCVNVSMFHHLSVGAQKENNYRGKHNYTV